MTCQLPNAEVVMHLGLVCFFLPGGVCVVFFFSFSLFLFFSFILITYVSITLIHKCHTQRKVQ